MTYKEKEVPDLTSDEFKVKTKAPLSVAHIRFYPNFQSEQLKDPKDFAINDYVAGNT